MNIFKNFQEYVVIELSSDLIGMSAESFDSETQDSFKTVMAKLTPGMSPYNVNITSYYESLLARLVESTRLRGYFESSAKSMIKRSVPSSTSPSLRVPSSIQAPSAVNWEAQSLTKLTVNWELSFVLQDVMTSSGNSSDLLSDFINILSNVLTNTTNIIEALQNDNPQSFGSVTIVNKPVNQSNTNIKKVLAKSSSPTGQPTSSPTDLFGNAKLHHIQMQGPLTASQFSWMIGLVVGLFFLLPTAMYIYRWLGDVEKKKMKIKMRRMRFEANKAKLSGYEIQRRNAIREAFRKKYGRDINNYVDCIETPKDGPQLQIEPIYNLSGNLPIPGFTESYGGSGEVIDRLTLKLTNSLARKVVAHKAFDKPPNISFGDHFLASDYNKDMFERRIIKPVLLSPVAVLPSESIGIEASDSRSDNRLPITKVLKRNKARVKPKTVELDSDLYAVL
jgi:hypothetical protein